MTLVAARRQIPAPATATNDTAGPADRDRAPERSRLVRLLEALADAGASFDPAAGLAARRFALIRERELRAGRW
jgi:hypothetical protein